MQRQPETIIKISSTRFESVPPPSSPLGDSDKISKFIHDFTESSEFSVIEEVQEFRSFMDDIPGKKRTCGRAFNKFLNNLFENPEGRISSTQRVFMVLYSLFEVYRIVISSYLIVFVPQNCGGYSCTIIQNVTPRDELEMAAISLNSVMAAYFLALLFIEFIREKKVRQYLIADKSTATDKDYLIKMMSIMKSSSREEILRLNNLYRFHSHTLLIFFFVNVGLSCSVIYKNYLNNNTVTVFITNALFMINRIHKALKITSSGEYNIYSAYRTDSLLYNRDRETWLNKQMEETDSVHCL